MTKKDVRSLYVYATENLNIRHDRWAKVGVSDDTDAEPTEKLRTIISKVHQTAIRSEEYRTLTLVHMTWKSSGQRILSPCATLICISPTVAVQSFWPSGSVIYNGKLRLVVVHGQQLPM
jgi:hypothetical protein